MTRGKATELGDFIDYSTSKGINEKTVEKMLLESGWPKEIIEKTLERTQKKGKKILSAGNNALKIVDVSKSFGANVVLDKINLSIKPGEIFGIIGLSGSGKTTLLNTIVGFVEPDSGDVVINSNNSEEDYLVSGKSGAIKKLFGFAAQSPSFYDKLTVAENIMHFSSLYEIPKKERKQRREFILMIVGLYENKKLLAQNLSGGMRKRLDIACSLVHNPKILILDEPTSDLDPLSRGEIWALVKKINSNGTTVILASHFVNELEELCSRFAILHNSRIKEVGTPDELKSSYSKDYEVILETKSKKYERIIKSLKSKKSLQIKKIDSKNRILTIFTSKPEQTLYSLAKVIEATNEKIVDISVNRPTIRELFESVVKK